MILTWIAEMFYEVRMAIKTIKDVFHAWDIVLHIKVH